MSEQTSRPIQSPLPYTENISTLKNSIQEILISHLKKNNESVPSIGDIIITLSIFLADYSKSIEDKEGKNFDAVSFLDSVVKAHSNLFGN